MRNNQPVSGRELDYPQDTTLMSVTDIMGEISAASMEQTAGVAQIGDAVGQMDQATQQNAALVEQSAAAAEGLKGQAQQLVDTVAVFKVSLANPGLVAKPARTQAAVERRGSDRARNVKRASFGAKAAAPTISAKDRPRKTGTNDEWASF